MINDNPEDNSLIYKLLKSEVARLCDAHKQLFLQLEHAKKKISQLTSRLEAANNEIETLKLRSRQDRRKHDIPYSGKDRRQFNLPATQH